MNTDSHGSEIFYLIRTTNVAIRRRLRKFLSIEFLTQRHRGTEEAVRSRAFHGSLCLCSPVLFFFVPFTSPVAFLLFLRFLLFIFFSSSLPPAPRREHSARSAPAMPACVNPCSAAALSCFTAVPRLRFGLV